MNRVMDKKQLRRAGLAVGLAAAAEGVWHRQTAQDGDRKRPEWYGAFGFSPRGGLWAGDGGINVASPIEDGDATSVM